MNMQRKIAILLLGFSLLAGIGAPAALAAPYSSYTYSYWMDAVPAPAAYTAKASYTGDDLGVGPFNSPQDLFADPDGNIYVADTGNRRIVVLDSAWRAVRTIDSFERDGKKDGFKTPNSVFVAANGDIYVADLGNQRVVVLSRDGTFLKQFDHPTSDILPAGFAFNPLKIAVDRADRLYVVARGVFEGIMQFNPDGSFLGYMGTVSLKPNLYDYFWKLVSTKAQRAQMELYVPTEFTNLDMDDKGFILSTNLETGPFPIKRINPSGQDVLKRFGYFEVKGDVSYLSIGDDQDVGPSQLKDIAGGPNGTYSVLDTLRGRIFTYDEEGNLLYIFGRLGTEQGSFKVPSALERVGDDFLVLDAGTNRITRFSPTAFARNINAAVALHHAGRDSDAAAYWRGVLQLDANYDLAYVGIGKALMREGKYKEAMHNFKLGMNRKYYANAFALYRKQLMRDHMGTFLTGLLVLIVALAGWRTYRRIRNRRSVSRAA